MRKLALILVLLAPMLAVAEETRTISTSGNADVRVAPDEIEVTLGIETKDKNLAVAKRANDERLQKTMAVFRTLKIESKHVQLDYVAIEPEYDRDRNLMTYWVRKNVAVVLKDTAKLDALLAQALEAGVNHVHNVELRTTELRKHRDRARSMAIRAAREKAVALAGELGQRVGRARTIHEGSGHWRSPSSWGGGRWNMQAQNVVQNQGGGPSEDAGSALGQIAISATVSVVFDLEVHP